jgi:2-polyprenyl-6-methoxyphenol hydroxylase-like FAD-dependent oxidoreductase
MNKVAADQVGREKAWRKMATPDSSFCSGHEAIDIVIVGGGVAGLATALALHRIGLESLVLERSDTLRASGTALLMWANAWKALDALGVADTLRANYFLLDGIRGFSNCSGVQKDVQLIKDRTGGSNMNCLESRCIERSALLETLAKALPDGSIRFNSKLVSIHKKGGSPFTTLELADGASITAKIVIGCEGVHSVVARWIGLETAKPSGRVAFRGMATFPEGHHTIEEKMVIIMGKGVRAGFIPCTDKQIYWFITRKLQPQDADVSCDPETLRCAALEAVRDFPEPIGEFIKCSSADTFSFADLKMRWFWPWEWDKKAKGRGSVTLVGDALHPMMPDLGQGACSALEDAVVLARCLSASNINAEDINWGEEEERKIEECFKKYAEARKWRVLGMTGGAFLAGNVMDGYSSFLRLVREWFWLPVISMSYIPYFAASDCGTLPLESTPAHSHAHKL